MPHECVDCGEVCEDGSSDVFEGCPSCGGTKFFYVREVTGNRSTEDGEDRVDGEEEAAGQSSASQSTLEDIAGKASAATEKEISPPEDAVEIGSDGSEHSSQQRARAVTVSDDDVDGAWPDAPESDSGGSADEDGIVEADGEYERAFGGKIQNGEPEEEETDSEILEAGDDEATEAEPASGETITRGDKTYERVEGSEAKERLAAEFETIKIVEPGSYELNLMNLYDRDEKIIALEEDGRYQVSLPTFEE